MTKLLRPLTILLAAGLAATVVGSAQAAPRALQQATNTCWRDVVNDWIRHQPNVLGTYPIPCYTQAIQHLNQYPDVAGYSSAPDDIHRALLAAIRNDRGDGGGSGGSSSSGPGGGSTPPSDGSNPSASGGPSTDSGGNNGLLGLFGAHDATSIPLPLIILGSLAILLALAALATWLARRFQTRRPAPAPAVSRRR